MPTQLWPGSWKHAVIIEVSMVQVLRLIPNPWRVHEAKYLQVLVLVLPSSRSPSDNIRTIIENGKCIRAEIPTCN